MHAHAIYAALYFVFNYVSHLLAKSTTAWGTLPRFLIRALLLLVAAGCQRQLFSFCPFKPNATNLKNIFTFEIK
jgi:hypothetical protein